MLDRNTNWTATFRTSAKGYATAVLGISLVTTIFAPFHDRLNHTTVALSYLLVVLSVATLWGRWPALVASALGMICFNFFFLPPVYDFTIADPQNWVALGAFLVTAMTAGQLSELAKRRAAETEAARKETRARSVYQRSLLEASLDPQVTIGSDGRINDVNSVIETVTGRSRAELIGTDFSDCFTDPQRARAAYQQVLSEGFVRDCLLHLRHRDGLVTSVLYNASLYRDDKGKVMGVVAAARSISTSIPRLENALIDAGVVSGLNSFVSFTSILSVAVGMAGLVGWALGISILKSVIPGDVMIKPNAALCLVLIGCSLWLLRKKEDLPFSLKRLVGRMMAAMVALVGLFSLAEHLFGWDLQIDQLLFRDENPWEAFGSVRPGLIAPITALDFFLLGVALILLDSIFSLRSRRYSPAQLLALFAGIGAFVGLLDFVLGGHTSFTHIALQTSVMLFLLACSLISARSEWGLAALIASSSVGGTLTRRLLPAAMIIPLVIGALAWKSYGAGLTSEWGSGALMTIAMIFLLGSLTLWNGYTIDRSDSERRKTEVILREREEQLREAERLAQVASWWWDPKADRVTWSEEMYRLTCCDPKLPPPRYKDQSRFYTPASFTRLTAAVDETIQTGRPYDLDLEMVRADGAVRVVTERGEVERDNSGNIALVRGTVHDITELKRAEDEARLLERLHAVVAELGQRALRGDCPQDVFDETVARIAGALDIEFCKVLELLPGGRELLLRAGVGWKKGLVGKAKVGSGEDSQAGFTLISGEPVIVHDLRVEERFSGPPLLHEHGVISGMSVIIPTSEGPYGVLGAHTTHRRTFSSDEVHFLQSVANVLGSMIDRTLAEEALRESEVNLSKAQAIAHIGSWHLDIACDRLTWSDEVYRIFGIPKETALTYETFLAGVHPEDKDKVNQAWTAALKGALYDIEHRIAAGNSVKWVREIARVQFDDGGKAIEGDGTVQDITERKLAEMELRRATRAQRALSMCNQALIRATDEPSLLQQICRIVVEDAGYRLCWVGSAEKDAAKSIRPIAQAGMDNGFLKNLNLSWADNDRGQGPTGTCIRTKRTVLSSNIATDPKMAPWRDEALSRGYGSSIAIPLITDNAAFGALDIYGSEPKEFGAEEIDLLTELASDVAFGITALRTRDERARAEKEVLTLNAELEQRVTARTAELEATNRLKDELILRQQATSAELAEAREKEIEIGYHIQQTLLLDRPPIDIAGLRVAALTIPSQRIDGDFYVFFKHPEQRLDVIVGDVMGKGVPAALLGAATKGHFIEALSHLLSLSHNGRLPQPKEIVTLAHAEVARHLISLENFVTLCYARLDLNKRTLDLVDCGHTGIIHLSAKTGDCELVQGNNLPLGIRENEIFEQISVPFDAGDVMIFYSDGVTEARSPSGELFGAERLVQCITSNRRLDPEALVEAIRYAAVTFSEPGHLTDDLTCVAIKIDEVATPLARAKREIRSDLKELSRAREFVRMFCAETPGFRDPEKIAELELAVTETASNIIKHAYHGRSDQSIQLDAEAFENQIILRLHHLGDSFDPQSVCLPSLDYSRESGFGLFLIGGTVDEIRYYRDDRGRNCIVLVKNRQPAGTPKEDQWK